MVSAPETMVGPPNGSEGKTMKERIFQSLLAAWTVLAAVVIAQQVEGWGQIALFLLLTIMLGWGLRSGKSTKL